MLDMSTARRILRMEASLMRLLESKYKAWLGSLDDEQLIEYMRRSLLYHLENDGAVPEDITLEAIREAKTGEAVTELFDRVDKHIHREPKISLEAWWPPIGEIQNEE